MIASPIERWLITALISLLIPLASNYAQSVETVLDGSDFIVDYLVVGPGGNVYHADRANRVHQITADGVTSVYATSTDFDFITGMAFDSNDNLYVSSGNNAKVFKVAPDGTISLFYDGLTGFNVGLTTDNEDNVYSTIWFGGRIAKIDQSGSRSDLASGLGTGAVDVIWHESGDLYAANFLDGNIFQISPDGNTNMIASINTVAGYMTYAGGYLYASGYETHYIYRISLTGDVVEFAGTGNAGASDGPVASAQFNVPNGIAATASGDTIYISHDGDGKLRRIVGINPTIAIEEAATSIPGSFHLAQNFPNPFNPTTQISFQVESGGHAVLTVFDMLGREVAVLFDDVVPAQSSHQVTFNASKIGSGTYVYKLQINGFSQTRKMLLLR